MGHVLIHFRHAWSNGATSRNALQGYHRLHTQILPLPPQPPPHIAPPLLAGRSRETPIQEGTVSASHRLGHALILPAPSVHNLPPSASHLNTASPPPAPTSHCTAAPGRPIARDPNTGGHGFSIASPRPFPHPTGPKRSYFSAVGFTPTPKYCLSPPSPPPHTAPPLLAGRSRETPVQEGTVSASHRLGHALILSAPTFHILLVWASSC